MYPLNQVITDYTYFPAPVRNYIKSRRQQKLYTRQPFRRQYL